MARRKQESVHVPASIDEARQMLGEYAQLERDTMLERLSADEAIARIKAQRDEAIAALQAEAKPLFDGLKAWWEGGAAKEIAGRNRSAELANTTIGIRKTPPAVKLARGLKLDDVIAWLGSLRLAGKGKFFRTPKTQLDKPAVIKAIREDETMAQMFGSYGVTVEQVDEFFIDTGLDEDALKTQIAAR